MPAASDILTSEGFRRIGALDHRLALEVWWNATAKIEVLTVALGKSLLLKGTKTYYLISVDEEGETWARDIAPLHDYLESHFRELHLSFSYARDVPAFLAEQQARARTPRDEAGTDVETIRRRREQARRSLRQLEHARLLDTGDSDLLRDHLDAVGSRARAEIETLGVLEEAAQGRADLARHLQQEYRRKGSAVCLTFSLASSIQVASSAEEIWDAARSIVKELHDADRFQVRQTLSGGRLRVKVAESEEPAVAWIEQHLGGMLNPSQLERLREPHVQAVDALMAHVAVKPDEDIEHGDSVLDHRKLLAPRVVSSLLGRLDKPAPEDLTTANGRAIRIGLRMDGDRVTETPCDLTLDALDHVYVCGMTRSGKTVAVRVLCEEVTRHEGVGVLVLDPRNQSAGVLVPQDRPELLDRFGEFGLRKPKGFPFRYFAPANRATPSLPADLGELADDHTALSLKGLSDEERCRTFRRVLDAVFERCSRQEVTAVRLVIVVEEAQLFTRRLVEESAKKEAEAAEAALNRVLREGRKYGICAIVSSQSIMDFSRDSAAIRQNAGTKVFFHNSDREIEYVRDYLDDPRALVRLRPGTAFICNPAWGVVKAAFRPPLSKVWDYSEAETAAILRGAPHAPPGPRVLSPDADRLLTIVRDLSRRDGAPPNMTRAAEAAGVTSKRRLQELVGELTAAGLVLTRRMAGPGQPKVIESLDASSSRRGTEGGHTADFSGRNPRDEAFDTN